MMMFKRISTHFFPIPSWCKRGGTLGVLVVLVCVLTWPGASLAQSDICGCTDNPNSLGAFDSSDEATWPPGTTSTSFNDEITIPLPDDGILIFDSFAVSLSLRGFVAEVLFGRNAANTPVTLLVKGDVTIGGPGPREARSPPVPTISVNGQRGINGSTGGNGIGGLGGPGGFRGGDGAMQLVTLTGDGGDGFGPGGGARGTASPLRAGITGTFIGVPELLPMVGGSGGGGGASTLSSTSCSGGGGGGGGGAILIVANGTITVNGRINSSGGGGGVATSFTCSSRGGNGSSGAIRLVADTITGSGFIAAAAVRLEAFTNNLAATATSPAASRVPAPGPVSNPLTPTLVITAINGQTQSLANGQLLSELPQGGVGAIDVILSVPGVVTVDMATTGVPSGTLVEVTAKPRVGGPPVSVNTLLEPGNCDNLGTCVAGAAFDLAAGAYVVEARATFQTP